MKLLWINGLQAPELVVPLFLEYTRELAGLQPDFQVYLDMQHFDTEVQDLHAKYGESDGCLLVLLVDGQAAGCVAMRKLKEGVCEMKRLYVRPAYRHLHLGNVLAEAILDKAKQAGYAWMYLDTLPVLEAAVHMYEKYGFEYCEAYNNSPVEQTLFMKKNLQTTAST